MDKITEFIFNEICKEEKSTEQISKHLSENMDKVADFIINELCNDEKSTKQISEYLSEEIVDYINNLKSIIYNLNNFIDVIIETDTKYEDKLLKRINFLEQKLNSVTQSNRILQINSIRNKLNIDNILSLNNNDNNTDKDSNEDIDEDIDEESDNDNINK